VNVLPYGESGLLVETERPLLLAAQAAGFAGVVEVVPAACTVLVRFDPRSTDARGLHDSLAEVVLDADAPATGERVDIEVRYDGADLAAVADHLGVSEDEVVARHGAAEYVVAFCGFSPGFAYLTGLDPSLHMPRLPEPRVSVPAGSVAIAGEFTGVYPRRSPGGWRLLGTTDADLWNAGRPVPALLSPGTCVRFVAR
jgi:KipI family sensor histidine kinase inhibitor